MLHMDAFLVYQSLVRLVHLICSGVELEELLDSLEFVPDPTPILNDVEHAFSTGNPVLSQHPLDLRAKLKRRALVLVPTNVINDITERHIRRDRDDEAIIPIAIFVVLLRPLNGIFQ